MKYFSIKELTKSETATKKGIDNTPNAEQIKNMETLINNLLDPIREQWGAVGIIGDGRHLFGADQDGFLLAARAHELRHHFEAEEKARAGRLFIRSVYV